MTIGDKIKELRKEKGLLQKEFAVGIGVNQQTVSGWENGVIEPTISRLKRIADFCGITLDYFKEYNIKEEKKDSVTELLEKLINQGKIKTPEDISGELADLILYAVKMDAQMKLFERD